MSVATFPQTTNNPYLFSSSSWKSSQIWLIIVSRQRIRSEFVMSSQAKTIMVSHAEGSHVHNTATAVPSFIVGGCFLFPGYKTADSRQQTECHCANVLHSLHRNRGHNWIRQYSSMLWCGTIVVYSQQSFTVRYPYIFIIIHTTCLHCRRLHHYYFVLLLSERSNQRTCRETETDTSLLLLVGSGGLCLSQA